MSRLRGLAAAVPVGLVMAVTMSGPGWAVDSPTPGASADAAPPTESRLEGQRPQEAAGGASSPVGLSAARAITPKDGKSCSDAGAKRTTGDIRFVCQATAQGLQWVAQIPMPAKVVHDIRTGKVTWSYAKKAPKALRYQVQVVDSAGKVLLSRMTAKAGKRPAPTTLTLPKEARGSVRVRVVVEQRVKNVKRPKLLYGAWSASARTVGFGRTPVQAAEEAWTAVEDAVPALAPVTSEQTPLGSETVLPTTPEMPAGLRSPDGYDLTFLPPTSGGVPSGGEVSARELPNGVNVFGSAKSPRSVAVFQDNKGRLQVAITSTTGVAGLRRLSIPLLTSARLGAVVQSDGSVTLQRLLQTDNLGTPEVEPDVWETVYTVTVALYDSAGKQWPVTPVVTGDQLGIAIPGAGASGSGTHVLVATWTQEADALGFYLDVASQWEDVQEVTRAAAKRGRVMTRAERASSALTARSFMASFEEWLAVNQADKKDLPRRYVSVVPLYAERYLTLEITGHTPKPSGDWASGGYFGVNDFRLTITNMGKAPILRDRTLPAEGGEMDTALILDVAFVPPSLKQGRDDYEKHGAHLKATLAFEYTWQYSGWPWDKYVESQGCAFEPGRGPDFNDVGRCEIWALAGQEQRIQFPGLTQVPKALEAPISLVTNGSHVEDVTANLAFWRLSASEQVLEYRIMPLPILKNRVQQALEDFGHTTFPPAGSRLPSDLELTDFYSAGSLAQAARALEDTDRMLKSCGLADGTRDIVSRLEPWSPDANGNVSILVNGERKSVPQSWLLDIQEGQEGLGKAVSQALEITDGTLSMVESSMALVDLATDRLKDSLERVGLIVDSAQSVLEADDVTWCAVALGYVSAALSKVKAAAPLELAFGIFLNIVDRTFAMRIEGYLEAAANGECWWITKKLLSQGRIPGQPATYWTAGQVRYTTVPGGLRDVSYPTNFPSYGVKCVPGPGSPTNPGGDGVAVNGDVLEVDASSGQTDVAVTGVVPGQWVSVSGFAPNSAARWDLYAADGSWVGGDDAWWGSSMRIIFRASAEQPPGDYRLRIDAGQSSSDSTHVVGARTMSADEVQVNGGTTQVRTTFLGQVLLVPVVGVVPGTRLEIVGLGVPSQGLWRLFDSDGSPLGSGRADTDGLLRIAATPGLDAPLGTYLLELDQFEALAPSTYTIEVTSTSGQG